VRVAGGASPPGRRPRRTSSVGGAASLASRSRAFSDVEIARDVEPSLKIGRVRRGDRPQLLLGVGTALLIDVEFDKLPAINNFLRVPLNELLQQGFDAALISLALINLHFKQLNPQVVFAC